MRRLAFHICCISVVCIASASITAAVAQSALDKRWPGDPEPAPPAQPQQQQQQQQQPPQQNTAQPRQPAAPKQAAPAQAAPAQATPAPPAEAHKRAAAPKPPAQPAHAVTCAGLFGKEASQAKFEKAFGANNVTWAEVDGPDATKLNATVLYPRDPKRRLEVLWNSEEARSDTQVVAINGQSTWTAPKGVKLGMTIAALEKLNGKPFAMNGFKGDNGGRATSWNGGALEKIPGDCKVGVRFAPAANSPAPAAGAVDVLTSDKEFLSNAPAMKPLSPKISEIIIGY